MSRLADLLCTEQSINPAVSPKLLEDQRRLNTFLEQEGRFIPIRRSVDEVLWTSMLLSIYEVRMKFQAVQVGLPRCRLLQLDSLKVNEVQATWSYSHENIKIVI